MRVYALTVCGGDLFGKGVKLVADFTLHILDHMRQSETVLGNSFAHFAPYTIRDWFHNQIMPKEKKIILLSIFRNCDDMYLSWYDILYV